MASNDRDGSAVDDAQLKAFLGSAIFIVPCIAWQAWVLGATFRQRRGKLVADKPDKASASEPSTPASPSRPSPDTRRWRPLIFVLGVSLLFVATQAWLRRVLIIVPAPYLDEIFHIPQAQTYCAGRWTEWDDKITTPPGLYLFSVAYRSLWKAVDGCSIWALRGANSIAVLLVAIVACSCRAALEAQASLRLAGPRPGHLPPVRPLATATFSLYAFHTALNVALFPVLFFFSALYYTDVYATLVTLLAYRVHLFRSQFAAAGPSAEPPAWSGLLAVVLGLVALLMRQTNVFWVVVYMGGLEAVQAVDESDPETVDQSWPIDALQTLINIALRVLRHPLRVLLFVWPHLLVLGAFVAFVVWNDGVVLGDKANHVATLHPAQLLYMWALLAFFSAPLCLVVVRRVRAAKPAIHSPAYYPMWLLAVLAVALAMVYYGTIVHPFTLADNRHYMFYVFRYTIRHRWVRYALVPAYPAAAWACWRVLGGGGRVEPMSTPTPTPTPIQDPKPQKPTKQRGKKNKKPDTTTPTTDVADIPDTPEATPIFLSLLDEEPAAMAPPATSTALLWLLASALSLVTAPLVEPRYFILPWVFWRLLVPAVPVVTQRARATAPPTTTSTPTPASRLTALAHQIDGRLVLETLWFLAINAATMYLFLFRPYVWRAEDGSLLDDGRLQRFMW